MEQPGSDRFPALLSIGEIVSIADCPLAGDNMSRPSNPWQDSALPWENSTLPPCGRRKRLPRTQVSA